MYQQSTYLNKHLKYDIRRLFRVIYLYKRNPLVTNRLCAHKIEPKANLVIATKKKNKKNSLSFLSLYSSSDNIRTENIKNI